MESRAAMRRRAQVAAAKGPEGFRSERLHRYRAALKRDTIPNDQLEDEYRKVIDASTRSSARYRRRAEPADGHAPRFAGRKRRAAGAALPAAPLVGNTGQQGQFVLPVSVPTADGKALQYDDFNYPSAAWTLSAHEGRPGHELQFTAMIERGVSLARSMFAFNSVNMEGWALYAEAEMVPYEPVDGQFIALQLRLLRAARAILDPMLNLA